MIDEQRRQYLAAMGIDVWLPRDAADEQQAAVIASDLVEEPLPVDAGSDLDADIRACQRCPLAATRTQVVIGRGSLTADWLIIGEAPGAEEDKRGQPFVGPAGGLLERMLKAIDLSADDYYIANTVKCRPPGNRNPAAVEIEACGDFLRRQIASVQPRIILVLGRVAAQSILASDQPLARLRGRLHHHPQTGIPLVVTYHPAYLLRSPRDKGKSWQDLCLAREILRQQVAGPS